MGRGSDWIKSSHFIGVPLHTSALLSAETAETGALMALLVFITRETLICHPSLLPSSHSALWAVGKTPGLSSNKNTIFWRWHHPVSEAVAGHFLSQHAFCNRNQGHSNCFRWHESGIYSITPGWHLPAIHVHAHTCCGQSLWRRCFVFLCLTGVHTVDI